jgi:hypothetical protein
MLMTDDELPAELAELERELLARPRRLPPPQLRARVLASIRAQLDRRQRGAWRWVAAAVAALLWLNVSWSAVINTRLDLDAASAEEFSRRTEQIQRLVPDLPAAEVRRHAVLLTLGGDTPYYRQPAASTAGAALPSTKQPASGD